MPGLNITTSPARAGVDLPEDVYTGCIPCVLSMIPRICAIHYCSGTLDLVLRNGNTLFSHTWTERGKKPSFPAWMMLPAFHFFRAGYSRHYQRTIISGRAYHDVNMQAENVFRACLSYARIHQNPALVSGSGPHNLRILDENFFILMRKTVSSYIVMSNAGHIIGV